MTRVGQTAVVVGGGIAGLAAARTLADRFDRVVVLDRDRLPADAAPRRGVPQGEHGHVLLIAGQRALEGLFPGLRDELLAAGAVDFDQGTDLVIYRYGAVFSRSPSELRLVTFSRPLLELTIRQRIQALPNVEVRDDTAVSALTGAGRVTGVRLDDGTDIDAELVVDCSGKGNRSNRWLSALGFPAPAVSEVRINFGYASRLYRRTPGDLPDGRALYVLPSPPDEFRAGGALPIEEDRWLVSLGGWHDRFPRDAAEFEKHAKELGHPGVAALIERCEPLSDLAIYQFPGSRRRHFETLRDRPLGYLALGDAVCSFNPVYGQGMTCAAVEAAELGTLLDKHGAVTGALAGEYYRAVARIVATPWQFAAGGDFAYPQTTGVRPRAIGLLNAYSRRIQLASIVDSEVRDVFTRVQHLILDPAALRRPSMILKVLRGSRRALATVG